MNEHDKLEVAIRQIPDEYWLVRNVCLNLFEQEQFEELRTYTLGALDMAGSMTSNENILSKLRGVRNRLKEFIRSN